MKRKHQINSIRPVFTSRDRKNCRVIASIIGTIDTDDRAYHPTVEPRRDGIDPALYGVNPELQGVR